ncbi:hypothetical protein KSP40_PGU001057 [Platanthera guangdongensis]|uniref:Uncharacterized protein n=1 Tax=Platanthera guangdongensis TaxID=2320717 RepID=A0ABR2MCX6_9ASPA
MLASSSLAPSLALSATSSLLPDMSSSLSRRPTSLVPPSPISISSSPFNSSDQSQLLSSSFRAAGLKLSSAPAPTYLPRSALPPSSPESSSSFRSKIAIQESQIVP